MAAYTPDPLAVSVMAVPPDGVTTTTIDDSSAPRELVTVPTTDPVGAGPVEFLEELQPAAMPASARRARRAGRECVIALGTNHPAPAFPMGKFS
jgi:hypothetical protein